MTVRQMTAQTLNALKGWPHMAAVDFEASFSADIPDDDLPVPPGSVVHLDSDGEFILGVGTSNVMPMFTFHASDDYTVAGDGGDASTDAGVWIPITPTGTGLAFPAVIAAELVSTAYKVDDTFVPNALLTSDLSGGSNPGLLKIGVLGTDMIVGMVSRGVVNNGYGHNAVAFWPILGLVYP